MRFAFFLYSFPCVAQSSSVVSPSSKPVVVLTAHPLSGLGVLEKDLTQIFRTEFAEARLLQADIWSVGEQQAGSSAIAR